MSMSAAIVTLAPNPKDVNTTEVNRAIASVNLLFGADPYFSQRGTFPVRNPDELFLACADGVLFNHLIMMIAPGLVNPKRLFYNIDLGYLRGRLANPKGRSNEPVAAAVVTQIAQNMDLFNTACSKIPECLTINITTNEIVSFNHKAVLCALLHLLRTATITKVSLLHHLPLARLVRPGETSNIALMLKPEELILRWVNFQLHKAGSHLMIKNTSGDLKDSEVLLRLLQWIAPDDVVDKEAIAAALALPRDHPERPDVVSRAVDTMECIVPVIPEDIVQGKRFVLQAVLASIIDKYPRISFPTKEEYEEMQEELADLALKVEELRRQVDLTNAGKEAYRRLQEELQAEEEDVRALEQDAAALEQEGGQLTEAISLGEAAEQRLLGELEQGRAEAREAREAIVREALHAVDGELRALKKSWEERLGAKEELVASLEEERGEQAAELEEERRRKKEAREERDSLEASIKELEEALPKVRKDIAKMEAEAKEGQALIAQADAAITELRRAEAALRREQAILTDPSLSRSEKKALLSMRWTEEEMHDAIRFVEAALGTDFILKLKKGRSRSGAQVLLIAIAIMEARNELAKTAPAAATHHVTTTTTTTATTTTPSSDGPVAVAQETVTTQKGYLIDPSLKEKLQQLAAAQGPKKTKGLVAF